MPQAVCSPSTSDLTKLLQSVQNTAEGKRTVWGTPIPWQATPVFAQGFQVAPAYGAANQVILCTYQVPRGYNALLCGLVIGYAGGSSALPGQVIFSVDVDNPSAAVVSPQKGYTEKDYAAIPYPLGSLVGGPVWPVEFKQDEGETVRVKGYTVSTVATGAGNFLYAALVGFQWPTMGWEG
jgi:hypothetical protein